MELAVRPTSEPVVLRLMTLNYWVGVGEEVDLLEHGYGALYYQSFWGQQIWAGAWRFMFLKVPGGF